MTSSSKTKTTAKPTRKRKLRTKTESIQLVYRGKIMPQICQQTSSLPTAAQAAWFNASTQTFYQSMTTSLRNKKDEGSSKVLTKQSYHRTACITSLTVTSLKIPLLPRTALSTIVVVNNPADPHHSMIVYYLLRQFTTT